MQNRRKKKKQPSSDQAVVGRLNLSEPGFAGKQLHRKLMLSVCQTANSSLQALSQTGCSGISCHSSTVEQWSRQTKQLPKCS